MNNTYVKSLDGVRAVAIILVMTFHAGLNHFGWVGVQLFFVLSGFLITNILWHEKQKPTSLGFKLKKFWTRRSLRIFPLYFGYLIVLGLVYLVTGFPSYYPNNAPYLFTYVFNYTRLMPHWQGNPLFTHLWSLCVEEQFYLFFPLIVFFIGKTWLKWFLAIFLLLGPVIRSLLFEHYAGKTTDLVAADAVYWNTLSHIDAFFTGGIIAVVQLWKRIKHPGIIFLLCSVLLLAAGALNYRMQPVDGNYFSDLGYHHDHVGNYAHVWRYTLLNLCFGALLCGLVSAHAGWKGLGRLRKIFESRVLVAVGRVSYGMYVFHWLIFVYVFSRLLGNASALTRLLVFIPYVVAVYLVAELSYRTYELYFIRLKDKWFR